MIVVEVLMTSCQVSENPNSGPETAQRITRPQQATNTSGRPVQRAVAVANRVKA